MEEKRSVIIQYLIVFAASVLLIKAASIQLFDPSYRQKADARTMDKKTLYPSRGLMYDRNGDLLVYNNPMYDILVTYNHLKPPLDTAWICSLLKIDKGDFISNISRDWSNVRFSKHVPFVFKQYVTPETFAGFQESLHLFPGFSYQIRSVRGYQYDMAPHALGYLSEASPELIDNSEGSYNLGDYVGIAGIERTYEGTLRGRKGVSYVLRDYLGREVSSIRNASLDSSATTGLDLELTLDRNLQQYAEALLTGKKGSIVCIEPATGEILTLASSPAYDPELLSINEGRSRAFSQLQSDSLNPFFDRSVMAAYPPGSIFKPILALIAMQEGISRAGRTIYCDGAYRYKNVTIGCHDHKVAYNIPAALQHSCNSYFIQVFRDFVEQEGFARPQRGLSKLAEYLHDFGLGGALGADIPNEKGGNVPLPAYYDKLYGDGAWRSTFIMSLGIGQGELQMTTLQMANLAAIIANRGYYIRPHLLRSYVNASVAIPNTFTEPQYVPISPEYFEPVIYGMSRAVSAGTATSAALPTIEVCGKTGTSENPIGNKKDHSVFFAFAPRENPQIAVAVYVENGGWGASYAAPMASLMIEKYLNSEIAASRQWIEQRMMEANLLSQP